MLKRLLKAFGITLLTFDRECLICGESQEINYKGYFTEKSMTRKPLYLCEVHNYKITERSSEQ